MNSRELLQWVQWLLRVLNRSPWSLGRALEELAQAMADQDAVEDCPGMLQAWSAVVTCEVKDTDRVGLPAAGFLSKAARPLSDRQAVALNVARESGRVTVAALRDRCPGMSPETYRTDLVDLIERGRLEPMGEKRGRYYVARD
jgi:hypothetical protein